MKNDKKKTFYPNVQRIFTKLILTQCFLLYSQGNMITIVLLIYHKKLKLLVPLRIL